MPISPFLGGNILSGATRKRRVLGEPDNTDLLMTPPFVPDLPLGGNPVPTTPGKVGPSRLDIIGNILNSIATGVGIGFSDNPSEALMRNLAQQRENTLARQQMEFERQRQERQIEGQKELEAIQQKGKEKISGIEHTQRKELQGSEQKHQIFLNSEKFNQDKELQKQDAKTREALQMLDNDFKRTLSTDNQTFQLKLEEERNKGDIKNTMIKSVMGALLSANRYKGAAPISAVMNIVHKLNNDIAFTKDDFDVVEQAFKINRIAATMSGGGGAGAPSRRFMERSTLDLQNDIGDMIKTIWKSTMEPIKNPITGEVIGYPDPEVAKQRIQEGIEIFQQISGNQLKPPPVDKGVTPEDAVDIYFKQNLTLNQILNKIQGAGMSDADTKRAKDRLKHYFKVLK